jgi:hypothetical protein
MDNNINFKITLFVGPFHHHPFLESQMLLSMKGEKLIKLGVLNANNFHLLHIIFQNLAFSYKSNDEITQTQY